MIAQQTMIIDLSKRTVDSVTRIESFLKDPRPAPIIFMALARRAELSESRRSLQRRDRPQILHPRRPEDAAREASTPPARPRSRRAAYRLLHRQGERASFRPDMPAPLLRPSDRPETSPKDAELDRLFEAKRADTGAPWSKQAARSAGSILCSHQKSLPPRRRVCHHTAEAAAIKNAILAANDAAMRYAATDLGFARKGHAERMAQIRARLDGSLLSTPRPPDARSAGRSQWRYLSHRCTDRRRPALPSA